jgi:hypothetical protein
MTEQSTVLYVGKAFNVNKIKIEDFEKIFCNVLWALLRVQEALRGTPAQGFSAQERLCLGNLQTF